ncbi:hypothetical protein LSAT2_000357 [Lamellibrachia satsuma]|nr:hypothetical protein LSAT2_000357 [Lamellibrachia satsuma]
MGIFAGSGNATITEVINTCNGRDARASESHCGVLMTAVNQYFNQVLKLRRDRYYFVSTSPEKRNKHPTHGNNLSECRDLLLEPWPVYGDAFIGQWGRSKSGLDAVIVVQTTPIMLDTN